MTIYISDTETNETTHIWEPTNCGFYSSDPDVSVLSALRDLLLFLAVCYCLIKERIKRAGVVSC